MDREELMDLLRSGPTLIRMNDGREYLVENLEWVTVSTMAAHVLRRSDDGKLRAVILPLVTMTSAENVELADG
jgi:hypothetical protein